eukprot:11610-Eustigmatos_ZCMA.PRE.1
MAASKLTKALRGRHHHLHPTDTPAPREKGQHLSTPCAHAERRAYPDACARTQTCSRPTSTQT